MKFVHMARNTDCSLRAAKAGKIGDAQVNTALEELKRKGGITFGTGKPLSPKPPARLKPGKSIAEMVAEDRR